VYSDRFRKPQAPSSLFPSAAPTASLRTVGKAGKTLENRGFPSRLVARADRGAAPGARSGPRAVRRAQEAARPGGTPARRLRRSGQEAGFARRRPATFDAAAPKQDGGSAAAPPRMGSRFGRMRHFAGPRRPPRSIAAAPGPVGQDVSVSRSNERRCYDAGAGRPAAPGRPRTALGRGSAARPVTPDGCTPAMPGPEVGPSRARAHTRLAKSRLVGTLRGFGRSAGARSGASRAQCSDPGSEHCGLGLSPRTAACPWRPAAAPSSARGSSRRRR